MAAEISRTTKEGMAKRGAEGAVFGNPDILTTVQPLGVTTWSNSADDLVRKIADVLRDLDDPFEITYAEIAKLLNEKGLRTLQGNEWNASKARGPVRKARDLLRREEDAARRSLPTFGMD